MLALPVMRLDCALQLSTASQDVCKSPHYKWKEKDGSDGGWVLRIRKAEGGEITVRFLLQRVAL